MCDLSIISEKDVEATALKNKILAGKQLNERQRLNAACRMTQMKFVDKDY